MATKFVQATGKKLLYTTAMVDTDSDLGMVELLGEIQRLNFAHGLTMQDWRFTLHDYAGKKIGDYDWKNHSVHVSLGDLFG